MKVPDRHMQETEKAKASDKEMNERVALESLCLIISHLMFNNLI